jgi:predicted GNAT family acetyltransferase
VDVGITDAQQAHRYEARRDDHVVGFAEYQKSPEVVVFTHTVVEPAFEGHGIGSALIQAALDDVRQQRLAVVPLCPFVESWIERHPDYRDLLYERPQSEVSD